MQQGAAVGARPALAQHARQRDAKEGPPDRAAMRPPEPCRRWSTCKQSEQGACSSTQAWGVMRMRPLSPLATPSKQC